MVSRREGLRLIISSASKNAGRSHIMQLCPVFPVRYFPVPTECIASARIWPVLRF